MTLRSILISGAIYMAVTATAFAKETGELKIRFEYGGEAVAAGPITPTKDVKYCGQHDLVNEKLLVNPENKGIKNVIVYLYTGRGGSELPDVAPVNETRVLTIAECRFDPHIVLAQAGDILKIVNRDPVGHNTNVNFFNNQTSSSTVRSDGLSFYNLQRAEPAPIPVDCNIHPWMRAYLVVLKHPFAAKSDENGDLVIKGLPVGKELVFRVFHEAGRIDKVVIDGEPKNWLRGLFNVKVESGVNELATVVIPGEALATQ
ncbi:MAG: methylamine utilization protein [Planctomycetaceae bacterium]|nr:MAG: methylamine utilization protein [Planctomycetaceae bacterium]